MGWCPVCGFNGCGVEWKGKDWNGTVTCINGHTYLRSEMIGTLAKALEIFKKWEINMSKEDIKDGNE